MTTHTISKLDAIEILDSRGRPTVRATVGLDHEVPAHASVPSGASTGAAEAHELRDVASSRHRGLGCRRAVESIRNGMTSLVGVPFDDQAELDEALIELDGTPNKRRLGANAILGVSLAFARAAAHSEGRPLYEYFAAIPATTARLPRPMVNLFSGGKHAGGQVAVQDVLLVPRTAATMDTVLEQVTEIYRCAADDMRRTYGMRALTADEGGLAPDFPSVEHMLDAAVDAIAAAGLRPGIDVDLAIDVAASHFYQSGRYAVDTDGPAVCPGAMIERLGAWTRDWPIRLIEDGLAEDDWENWPLLQHRAAGRARVVGDDLLCTTLARIEKAVGVGACDALLLKVNQVGTVTEAARARAEAIQAGWEVIVSARSGETEDDWLADLAVGWAGDYIKIGSITQSERLSKYNRLLIVADDVAPMP